MQGLKLENISYTYSRGTPFEKKAIYDINVSFAPGKITGLIGHTGSGKSTLVQLINCIKKPDTGKIFFDGKNIWDEPKEIAKYRFKIGLVFQYPEYQLFEETVYKDIAFGPSNMGLPEEEINKKVESAAFFCGIGRELFEKSPFDLSGGQKRRVAIAGVIAMDPEVLILDEPAASLDPMGREEILGRVWSYQRERKSTVIIVSHSMEDMAVYCDELVVMNKGGIFMSGCCNEIFEKSDELEGVGLSVPQVAKFMKYLKNKGANVRENIFTVEEARRELKNYYFSK